MDYDSKLNTFVYNRILQDGMGPEHYGIEIANFIIEDNDFFERVNDEILIIDKYIKIHEKLSSNT